MRKWQYKVVRQRLLLLPGDPAPEEDPLREALLNSYGERGWELVAAFSHAYRRDSDPLSLQGYSLFSYYFKREAT